TLLHEELPDLFAAVVDEEVLDDGVWAVPVPHLELEALLLPDRLDGHDGVPEEVARAKVLQPLGVEQPVQGVPVEQPRGGVSAGIDAQAALRLAGDHLAPL